MVSLIVSVSDVLVHVLVVQMAYTASNPWYGFLLTASPFDAWRICYCNIHIEWGDTQATGFNCNSTTQPNNLTLVHNYSGGIAGSPYIGGVRIENAHDSTLSTTTIGFQVHEFTNLQRVYFIWL